ncbi:MAG TPA: HAMP domain-containing sensor histidine kinase, partial [Chloroflexota bacterium]|nr:HAMP domain-containing sensor histidine kinase [Chloroflexota bacterium]
DLKTPLTAIKASIQLMVRRQAGSEWPNDDWPGDELRRLERTVERMTNLLNELLDIGQMEDARPLELARTSFDLGELVREVAAELGSTTTQHRIEVHTPDEPTIGGWDRERLGRVLANLIENAIKYSPDGGDIRADVSADDGCVSITISDEGIGVPAEDVGRIFERFRRGSNVPDLIGGTGVGLAYARWVVMEHGGHLRVESTPGRGSSFRVELPLDSAVALAAGPVPA